MRYFYVWTPLVIVGTVVLLSLPWLGLIALMVFALVPLVALAWAIAFVPYMLSRAISGRWDSRGSANVRRAAAFAPTRRQDNSVLQRAPSHAAALSLSRDLQAPQHTFPEGHVS